MRLYDEIFKDEEGKGLARCILSLSGGGYFEGVKAVGEFAPDKILLCFPHRSVEIEGENLTVKKYCDGDLQLSGKITLCRVIEPQTAR